MILSVVEQVITYIYDKYINIIEEKSTLRTLIKTGNEIITLGYDPTQEVDELMDNAEKKIFNIMQKKNHPADA